MTAWRDARLKRALDEAPDASQPPARARAAIRAAAHAAVRPWWRRLWPARADGGPPWTTAFATVLLAVLVTVLWQGREIPGARTEQAGADQPAPPPAVSAPVTAPVPVTGSGPAAASEPAAAPAPPAPAPAPAPPVAERPAAPQRKPTPADAAAPAAAEMRAREDAGGAGLQRQVAPPMARAPAPAPVPIRLEPWTQVRLEARGASVVVPRAQAGALSALLARTLRAPPAASVAAGAAQLRLEVSEGDQPLGALEMAENGWRWLPLRDGQPARGLQVEPELSQALREEAQRLLGQ